ncbi:MAG: exodeoxyribonuclease VII small subunit [Planctomycetes bacterium]|nr:exodeoxyribonuclease VII small subunit [Planctomycetota bacterium]
MTPSKKKATAEEQSQAVPFDARMLELEEIAAALESGDLGLEEALERYKRGVSLLRHCRSELEGFRSQVEELSQDGEGSQPLASDPDFAG